MKDEIYLRHLEFIYLRQLYLYNSTKGDNQVIRNIISYLYNYQNKRIRTLASQLMDEERRLGNDTRGSAENAEDLEDLVLRCGRDGLRRQRLIFNLFLEDQEKWQELPKRAVKTNLYKRFEVLRKLFDLDELSLKILALYFLSRSSLIFKKIDHEIFESEMSFMGDVLAKILEVSIVQLNRALSHSGPLFINSLMDQLGYRSSLQLADTVIYYLVGQRDTLFSEEYFTRQEVDSSFDLDSFPLNPIDHQVILSLFQGGKKGGHILLTGVPGTGKTEYCRALAKNLGLELYVARSADEDGDENIQARKKSIVYAQKTFKNKPVLIVIDEADAILETSLSFFFSSSRITNDRKSWINGILDDFTVPMIWVTNSIEQIDESTRRRFSYMVKFKNFDEDQRLQMWKKYQQDHELLFDDQELAELSKEFRINAGSISTAFRHAASLGPKVSLEEKKKMLRAIATNHQMMIGHSQSTDNQLTDFYDPKIINVSMPVENVITSVSKFYNYIQNDHGRGMAVRNMNILLQGPTGTGKTEFVKYLAKQTGKKVIQLNFSDLVSCYLGGTEKAIAEAFKRAQEEDSILFFDEADSLFTSRAGAERSWEVSRTNELLVQMERFVGVLVCSTNFIDQLDSASIRRFNIKVSFDHLNNDAKELLFHKMLSEVSLCPPSAEELNELHAIQKLSVGDFKVVMQRNFFLEKSSPKQLIDELRCETVYRGANKKVIGLN